MTVVSELSDAEREQEIAVAQGELSAATTREERCAAWMRMQALIKGRSAGQVARMESERGLA